MRFRSQLLLLSSLTLALPWAGVEGMRAIDKALRQSHSDNLAVLLEAVAGVLPDDLNARAFETPPYFVPDAGEPPLIDGYGDDWSRLPWQPSLAAGDKLRLKFSADSRELNVLATIRDADVHYYRPDRPWQNHDRLVLHTRDGNGEQKQWLLHTEAPAAFALQSLPDNHDPATDWRADSSGFAVSAPTAPPLGQGIWQATRDGYQLEFSLPLDSVAGGLQFALFDVNDDGLQRAYVNTQLSPLLQPAPELAEPLGRFHQAGLDIYLLNGQGWLLASHQGEPFEPAKRPAGYWIVEQLYKLMLATDPLPTWQPLFRNGRLQHPALLNSGGQGLWFDDYGSNRLVQLLRPPGSDVVLMAVARGDRPLQLASSAFDRLFATSILLVLLASASMLGYASWLSWRLRQLSQSAARRLQQLDAKTDTPPRPLPQQRARDEIGELAQNFNHLLERQQQHQDYLKTLGSKLSHELRTPLAIVKSSLENLQQINPDETSQQYCQRAISGSERLHKILTAMAEANHLEQSINEAEMEELPLDQLLGDIFSAYCQLNPTRRLRLELPPADYRARVAPELIAQLLEKLLDNALDFTPDNGEICLSLSRLPQQLRLTVTNQGSRLPDTLPRQLFDSLVSVRPKSSSSPHLGLGLYIVRLIAEFHQGRITARNLEDGNGVAFELLLPLSPLPEKSR